MKAEVEPVTTEVEEEYKKRRRQLKDELHSMLKAAGLFERGVAGR